MNCTLRKLEDAGANQLAINATKVTLAPEASVSKSGDQFRKGRRLAGIHDGKHKLVKPLLEFGSLSLMVIALLAALYYANGYKMAGLGCLSSLVSRCNPFLESSALAGRLWHDCSVYCNNCRGASFGVCTMSAHRNCFNELRLSRTCFCYGGVGVRDGNCWY